jgi:arabinofuranosyltransferase
MRASFVIDGERYFVLFDDMMISMRYAKNLALGDGLVWNRGEFVEGYTNLLWTLGMATIHIFPVPLSKTSLIVQLAGMFFLVLNLASTYYLLRLIHGSKRLFGIGIGVFFTAFYFPLLNWGVIQGTEVSLLTFLVTTCVLLGLQSIQKKQFSILLFILLGVATLVRLDAVAIVASIMFLLLIFAPELRTRILLIGIPIVGIFIGGQTAFRFLYYHEFLPNTYYLKMTGYPILMRIVRGVYVAIKFLGNIVFLLPIFLLFYKRNSTVFFLAGVFCTQVAYSIYVGGDAWEFFGGSNRYITIVMPLFFVLLSIVLADGVDLIRKALPKISKAVCYSALTVICSALFLTLNGVNDDMLFESLLLKPALTRGENQNHVRLAKALTQNSQKDEKIAVVWAGVIPYYSDRYFVDLLGKNEKVIARRSAIREFHEQAGKWKNWISYYPGHMKWDYNYVVREYKPDMFVQIFPESYALPAISKTYRKKNIEGFEWYVRSDNKKVQE